MTGLILFAGMISADPPPAADLARQWRLTIWQDEFSGIGLSVFTVAVRDGRAVLLPPADKTETWGRSVSDLEYVDGVLWFKVTFDTGSDNTKTRPLQQEWFEGRFHPTLPGRVWGVLGPRDAADDGRALRALRPAELNPVPAKEADRYAWAMPRVVTPGVAALQSELNRPRNARLLGRPLDDEAKISAVGHYWMLEEFAANRTANRRGFHLLCMLVRNAHLAGVPAERVSGWLGEILEYAAPYGPRYVTQLRGSLAKELEEGGEAGYKPLAERLRAGNAFPPPGR